MFTKGGARSASVVFVLVVSGTGVAEMRRGRRKVRSVAGNFMVEESIQEQDLGAGLECEKRILGIGVGRRFAIVVPWTLVISGTLYRI